MADPIPPRPLRLFIAIRIPGEVKEQIHQAQDELRRLLSREPIRWTGPDQFHLTLRFLGSVEANQVDALVQSVRHSCLGIAPIELCAQHIGVFPQRGLPRIVWVGIDAPDQKLNRLQSAIAGASSPFTIEPAESNFCGHVTLARIKQPNRGQAKVLSQFASRMAGCVLGDWIADRVEIMRSELSSTGARHESLAAVSLEI